nr:polysaccharide pyruvyl transferase family protein [uncultured Acetatifactor sp.]
MKIGIITWFTGPNLGTSLQAIALQRYLRNAGYEVEVINYEVVSAKRKSIRLLWQKVLSQPQKYAMTYAQWKYGHMITRRNRKIADAVTKNCILTDRVHDEAELIKVCNSFDILVCGSDQIWNPNWYHRFYFADYDEIQTRKISYAPSLGVNAIPDELKAEIERSIKKFDAVSVREEKGAEMLEPYVGSRPVVVVDPTFLLTTADWGNLFPGKYKKIYTGGYVLSMFLTDKKEHWAAANSFARKKGLRHVVIPYSGFSYLQKGEICADSGPEEFLELIRGACYVLTDSFHVTVFSIIYRKQFYTFRRFRENRFISQNTRISNLLKMADMEGRLVPYGSNSIFEYSDIEYGQHEEKIRVEIQKSKDFLKKAIEGEITI